MAFGMFRSRAPQIINIDRVQSFHYRFPDFPSDTGKYSASSLESQAQAAQQSTSSPSSSGAELFSN
jgi:hypothetical protein